MTESQLKNKFALAAAAIRIPMINIETSTQSGVPDSLLLIRDRNVLVEFKVNRLSLRPFQKSFHRSWRGGDCWIVVGDPQKILGYRSLDYNFKHPALSTPFVSARTPLLFLTELKKIIL